MVKNAELHVAMIAIAYPMKDVCREHVAPFAVTKINVETASYAKSVFVKLVVDPITLVPIAKLASTVSVLIHVQCQANVDPVLNVLFIIMEFNATVPKE